MVKHCSAKKRRSNGSNLVEVPQYIFFGVNKKNIFKNVKITLTTATIISLFKNNLFVSEVIVLRAYIDYNFILCCMRSWCSKQDLP